MDFSKIQKCLDFPQITSLCLPKTWSFEKYMDFFLFWTSLVAFLLRWAVYCRSLLLGSHIIAHFLHACSLFFISNIFYCIWIKYITHYRTAQHVYVVLRQAFHIHIKDDTTYYYDITGTIQPKII